jgi:hypothetical protein
MFSENQFLSAYCAPILPPQAQGVAPSSTQEEKSLKKKNTGTDAIIEIFPPPGSARIRREQANSQEF